MMDTPDSSQRRGLRSDQISGLMLAALALYVGWANRAYPLGTLAEPGPGYVPLLLAIFLGAMGVLVAVRGSQSQPFAAIGWGEGARAVVILLACGVAAYALERLGYRITIAAMLIFFFGVMERRRPWMVALVALGFSFISYYIFATLLRVPLPVSPWGV